MPASPAPSRGPATPDGADRTELVTVGHGTHSVEGFLGLLSGAGVDGVVDVRIGPGSRRNPHFGRDELSRWLPGAGISYRWEPRLGGFRKVPANSPDTALRNESFRAYAHHMRTREFGCAMTELVEQASSSRLAIMCSESVWWRCHRRLVADHAALIDALRPCHLMPDARLMAHRPTAGVRVDAGQLVYDATVA